jgi:hypothetical protein
VHATDDTGRQYDDPPARVTVMNDAEDNFAMWATEAIRLKFKTAGTRTIVARYGALADTLTLRVVRAP